MTNHVKQYILGLSLSRRLLWRWFWHGICTHYLHRYQQLYMPPTTFSFDA